jgi:hypothetical protein
LGIKFELGELDAAKLLDANGPQHHSLLARQAHPVNPHKRIGMTTYLHVVTLGARMRQLLFASVSPSSTSVPSTAANASSR